MSTQYVIIIFIRSVVMTMIMIIMMMISIHIIIIKITIILPWLQKIIVAYIF